MIAGAEVQEMEDDFDRPAKARSTSRRASRRDSLLSTELG
jgi:hypothetical protein